MGERICHRHRPAERMADERGLRQAEALEEGVQRAREVREAVRGARLRRAPGARQVDGIYGGAGGEGGHVVPPGASEAAETVQQDDRGAATFDEIVERESVDLAAPEPEFRHGARSLPECLRR